MTFKQQFEKFFEQHKEITKDTESYPDLIEQLYNRYLKQKEKKPREATRILALSSTVQYLVEGKKGKLNKKTFFELARVIARII